jgi:hypothetical protein
MSSTRSLYPQVVSRLLASFRAAEFRVSQVSLFLSLVRFPAAPPENSTSNDTDDVCAADPDRVQLGDDHLVCRHKSLGSGGKFT